MKMCENYIPTTGDNIKTPTRSYWGVQHSKMKGWE